MSSKKTLSKVSVPVLAAAAVGAIAFAGISAGLSSGGDEPSKPGAVPASAAQAPSQSKQTKAVGDDPAAWRLPIEAYMPTKAETKLVASVRDDLLDACMKNAGYADWTPAPDLPDVGGKTLTDWRYGIHDAGDAASRGYHPDAAEQQEYDKAMEAGAVDTSGADESKVRECVAETDGVVPSAQNADLVQQISGDAFLESQEAPQVVDVFSKWSSCMKEKGYDYKKPLDASDDPHFTDPDTVSGTEIATAKADIECRGRYDLEKTWFETEAALQAKAISSHQGELDDVKKANKASVAKASALAK